MIKSKVVVKPLNPFKINNVFILIFIFILAFLIERDIVFAFFLSLVTPFLYFILFYIGGNIHGVIIESKKIVILYRTFFFLRRKVYSLDEIIFTYSKEKYSEGYTSFFLRLYDKSGKKEFFSIKENSFTWSLEKLDHLSEVLVKSGASRKN